MFARKSTKAKAATAKSTTAKPAKPAATPSGYVAPRPNGCAPRP